MPHQSQPIQHFNLETMSGVFPGSRTAVYQRLRLTPTAGDGADTTPRWFQLQWYADPPGLALLPREMDGAPSPLLQHGGQISPSTLHRWLDHRLQGEGWVMQSCGLCQHWQPAGAATPDGLPLGHCRWAANMGDTRPPDALALQSSLALDCAHFAKAAESPVLPANPAASPRVPLSAELDPDRRPFWPRLWQHIRHKLATTRSTGGASVSLAERSGVGAGTEPCFVCQGRLANLGAAAVASPEGDKQTLSIWRCRLCQTTYFNDWIDRWERLESLETEERVFRIAPAEAFYALALIHGEVGGDHPAGRSERSPLRTKLLALVADREPISHQLRQGR
jgi:hypothetical protein